MTRETAKKTPPEHHSGTIPESSGCGENVRRADADSLDELGREYSLTDREQEALLGVALGLTTKEIAARMNVSPNTVKVFLRLLMIKSGVATRAGLLSKLMEHRSERTDVQERTPNQKQTTAETDTTGLGLIVERATKVLGERIKAMRWLGTPVRALDYATPISLLGTSEGLTRVADVLGQMEHGIW